MNQITEIESETKTISKKKKKEIKNILKYVDLSMLLIFTLFFAILILTKHWFSIISFAPMLPLLIWLNINNFFLISSKNDNSINYAYYLKNNSIRRTLMIISLMSLLTPSLFAILFDGKKIIFFFENWYYQFSSLKIFYILCLMSFVLFNATATIELIMSTRIFNKKEMILSEQAWDSITRTRKILLWYGITYYAIFLFLLIFLIIKIFIKNKK